MKKTAVGLFLALIMFNVNATSLFEGNNVDYTYLFPNESSLYSGPNTLTVGDGIEINSLVDGLAIELDIMDNGFKVSFNQGVTFNSSEFNGFKLTDSENILSDFISVNFIGGQGVAIRSLLFDANNIFVNWEGLSFRAGDILEFSVVGAPSAVPLPAALPLLLSGLGVLGFANRRKKHSF